jgi:hypothetical protein
MPDCLLKSDFSCSGRDKPKLTQLLDFHARDTRPPTVTSSQGCSPVGLCRVTVRVQNRKHHLGIYVKEYLKGNLMKKGSGRQR